MSPLMFKVIFVAAAAFMLLILFRRRRTSRKHPLYERVSIPPATSIPQEGAGNLSQAHVMLLTKMLCPVSENDLFEVDVYKQQWRSVLRESPAKAIRRLLEAGLIERAPMDLETAVANRLPASAVKIMLEERGLPTSGSKKQLVQRLVAATPDDVRWMAQGVVALKCTEQGRKIAENYFEANRRQKEILEEALLSSLRAHDFRRAAELLAKHDKEQVFSPRASLAASSLGGLQIQRQRVDVGAERDYLNRIFQARPRILAALSEEQLEHVRVAAGMMHLLTVTHAPKRWWPPDFKTGLLMDNAAAARMIGVYLGHLSEVQRYRETGVVKAVSVAVVSNSCEKCRELAGKRYALSRVPELPYERCTSDMGCRCCLLAELSKEYQI